MVHLGPSNGFSQISCTCLTTTLEIKPEVSKRTRRRARSLCRVGLANCLQHMNAHLIHHSLFCDRMCPKPTFLKDAGNLNSSTFVFPISSATMKTRNQVKDLRNKGWRKLIERGHHLLLNGGRGGPRRGLGTGYT